MDTLLLDRTTWDLLLDSGGNIAMASTPYAPSQDVASAVRVFKGECYYDTDLGLPYFQNILGTAQSLDFYETRVEDAALSVSDVASAKCIASLDDATRRVSGVILLTLTDGTTQNVLL